MLKNTKLFVGAALLATVLPFQQALASNYACAKTLDQVTVRTDGFLFIRFNGTAMVSAAICSLNSAINVTVNYTGLTYTWTITPEQCKSYQAMFMTAKATGRSIGFAWDLPSPPTCTSSTWTNPFDTLMAPYPYEFALY